MSLECPKCGSSLVESDGEQGFCSCCGYSDDIDQFPARPGRDPLLFAQVSPFFRFCSFESDIESLCETER